VLLSTYKEAFDGRYELRPLGKLHVSSGKLVACDPFFVSSAFAFERTISPGEYQVDLVRVNCPGWGIRTAVARILLLPEVEAAYIEPALCEHSGGNHYIVESGLGCFMDDRVAFEFLNVLSVFYKKKPTGNYYDDVLAQEFKAKVVPGDNIDGIGNIHVIGDAMNIAMFQSGLGDGTYGSYWAVGSNGEVISLFTDFEIFSQSIE
jgi:hypothetical protein